MASDQTIAKVIDTMEKFAILRISSHAGRSTEVEHFSGVVRFDSSVREIIDDVWLELVLKHYG